MNSASVRFAVILALGFTILANVAWGQTVDLKGLVQSSSLQGPAKPHYLMVAMGDSITAGVFADTTLAWFNKVQQGSYNENLWTLLASTFDIAKYVPPVQVTEALETRYELSWATGSWITSHSQLLKQYLSVNEPSALMSAVNVAKSGGLASDIITQAQQIVSLMASGTYTSLKYVTLLIGNNDACQGTDNGVMTQNLLKAFSILSQIKQFEPIRILVSGLPRIADLGQPQFMTAKTIFDLSCKEMRINIVNECKTLTDWSTDTEYQNNTQLVVSKNATLAQVVTQVNQTYLNIQAVFSNRLFGETLSVTDLAIDCFHPNADAQIRASTDLWNDQPWFH